MIPSLAKRREPLSYSIDKLGRRDEIVLKSSMRVLDHRFRHHWNFQESGGDVRVTTDAQGQRAGSVVMLYMGCEAIVKTRTLALPLRASEVELAFNHMGETLLRIRSAKGRVAPEPGTEVHIERTASAAAAPGWLARLRARHEPVSGGD